MAQLAPESETFSSLDKQIIGLTYLVEQMKEVLFQTRSKILIVFWSWHPCGRSDSRPGRNRKTPGIYSNWRQD